MKTTIPFGPNPDNVIVLDVVRDNMRMRRYLKECAHRKTKIDTTLSRLVCSDCGEHLNPVEWLAQVAELFEGLAQERARLDTARARYEAKQRCRCEHCGKITKVRPATAAQVRAMPPHVRQDDGNRTP